MNPEHPPSTKSHRIAIGLGAFVVVTAVASVAMPRLLWGLAAPADVVPWLLLLLVLAVLWSFRSGFDGELEAKLGAWGRPMALAVVVPLVLVGGWVGRIRLHWLGDQAIWLRSLQIDELFHVLEPASFALVRASADLWPGKVAADGVFALSVVMGGVFVLLTWLLAGQLESSSRARRAWLWGMLIFTPELLFFRGYVESYPFLLLSLLALAVMLLGAMRGGSLRWVWPAVLVSASTHVMGVGALPAVFYAGRQKRRAIGVTLAGCLLVALLVTAWILSQRSRMPPQMGSLRMTLSMFDLRSQGWEGFMSGKHWLGIGNILLLLGGPLLFTAPFLPWRPWFQRREARCLLILVAPGLIGLLLVRLLLGPVRDWDLLAGFLYFMVPALATAWLARTPGPALPRHSGALLALAFAHGVLWSSVDMDAERGLRRAERLYGEGSLFAPEARGRAAEDLAAAERMRGNGPGAERWYELATQAMPKHWRYQSNLGSVALGLGHAEKAKEAYERAVALNPPNRAPYASLGSIYLKEHRVVEALQTFDLGLARGGPDFGLLYGKAVCLAQLGDYAGSAAVLDTSLALSPGNAAALLYRGAVSLRMGEPRTAIRFLQDSLRREPGPEGWKYLLEAAQATGDSSLAAAARLQSPQALAPRP